MTSEGKDAIVDNIIEMLRDGIFDSKMDELSREVDTRKQMLKLRRVSEVHAGDIIYISQNCRPRMLAGQAVEVVGMDNGKIRVKLLTTYSAKWRIGNIITIPPSLMA
jgi:hypothetical protein